MLSWIRRMFGVSGVPHQSTCDDARREESSVVPPERLPKVTTGGMQAVVMIGDYDRSRLPASNDQIVLLTATGKRVRAKCGHRSRASLLFYVYGVKVGGHGTHLCADCSVERLGRITIRCALCGLPIIPGDGVAIYDCGGADIRDDIAFRVGEGQVLGCLRSDCTIPGAFAGHWGGADKGFISAFQ